MNFNTSARRASTKPDNVISLKAGIIRYRALMKKGQRIIMLVHLQKKVEIVVASLKKKREV